jgi:hypothetical protein
MDRPVRAAREVAARRRAMVLGWRRGGWGREVAKACGKKGASERLWCLSL